MFKVVKKRPSRSKISVFWLTRNAEFSWGRRKKGSRVSSVTEWELRWQVCVERFGLSKRAGLFGHKTRLWRVANSAFVEEMCRRRKEVILHILRLLVKQERILVIHVGYWAISFKRKPKLARPINSKWISLLSRAFGNAIKSILALIDRLKSISFK